MTGLEFVAAIAWPAVVLIVVSGAGLTLAFSQGLRDFFRERETKVGPQGVEFGPPVDQATLRGATSSDAAIAEHLGENTDDCERADPDRQDDMPPSEVTEPGSLPEQEEAVTAYRRAAVEKLMLQAARWGHDTARLGYRRPPTPRIYWMSDGSAEIGVEYAPQRGSSPGGSENARRLRSELDDLLQTLRGLTADSAGARRLPDVLSSDSEVQLGPYRYQRWAPPSGDDDPPLAGARPS